MEAQQTVSLALWEEGLGTAKDGLCLNSFLKIFKN